MKIEIPSACPVCDSELELVNDQLFCRNKACPAQSLKNLLHYTKTLKILGLGEKTLEKLDVSTINELYELTVTQCTDILGEKIGTKVYNELDKSKELTLQKFISAIGIPLIGNTAAEKIQKVVSEITEITEESCKKAGLGAKATANLVGWVNNEYYKYQDLPITFIESEPVESGLAICISGKVPGYTKAKIAEMLKDYNVTVKSSVTKDLDYLIAEDFGTTKAKKAEQYNIHIISFEKFMEMIKK